MKIWVDDVRPAPEGYDHHYFEVGEVITFLSHYLRLKEEGVIRDKVLFIDLDHDAGDYNVFGDYVKILDWLEAEQENYPCIKNILFHIHSMNPVGVQNMRAIIKKNGWKEIK